MKAKHIGGQKVIPKPKDRFLVTKPGIGDRLHAYTEMNVLEVIECLDGNTVIKVEWENKTTSWIDSFDWQRLPFQYKI